MTRFMRRVNSAWELHKSAVMKAILERSLIINSRGLTAFLPQVSVIRCQLC